MRPCCLISATRQDTFSYPISNLSCFKAKQEILRSITAPYLLFSSWGYSATDHFLLLDYEISAYRRMSNIYFLIIKAPSASRNAGCRRSFLSTMTLILYHALRLMPQGVLPVFCGLDAARAIRRSQRTRSYRFSYRSRIPAGDSHNGLSPPFPPMPIQ